MILGHIIFCKVHTGQKKIICKGFLGQDKRIVHVQQCMDIQLQRCNIRFGNYIFDMGSQGMRKVVKKLIEGITGADEPVKRAHSWTKNKYGEDIIKESLHGVVSQVDMDMLTLFMQELELYETQRE
ncbi:hypothetical protein EZS27_034193, partial [termite gut metagenome]